MVTIEAPRCVRLKAGRGSDPARGSGDEVSAEDAVGRGRDAGLAVGDDGRGRRQRGRCRRKWRVKVTIPPLTGSTGLLAVTITARG